MDSTILMIHSVLRWVLLAVAIYAIGRAKWGYFMKKTFTNADDKAGLFLTITADIQLLIGLILYMFYSSLTKAAFQDFGLAMKTPELRYYAVEHILVMVIAIVLFHIGKAKVKKADTDRKKHSNAMWFYGIGLLLILSRIPWGADRLMPW